MKGFWVFLRKEIRELLRTNKLLILLIVFGIVGIMNPATALFTPKLMEFMAEEYAEMGITVGEVTVTAYDAWAQFAKNMLTAVIVAVILFSSIYTAEYAKGTLIPLLTKGLSRSAAVLSKYAAMLLSWSAGLWLCFGITYGYSAFYWDNSTVQSIAFAGFCWWLFGVLLLSCIAFFSSFAASGAQVLLGTGAVYIVLTLIGLYGKAKKYLPTRLTDILPLYRGELVPSDYSAAVCITALLSLILLLAALPLTRRRQL